MMMLVLAMLLLGAEFGVRFKVLILIPAIGLAFITVLATGIARSDGASTILITAAVTAGCLQIGYFCGIIANYRSAATHTKSPPKAAWQADSAR